MSTTLNAIAIDVVGQCGQAAKHVVNAYRVGSERTITGLGGRYAQLLNARKLPLVTDELKTALIDSERRVSGLAIDAIAQASQRAQQAVERITNRTVEGMEVFNAKTAWADELMVVGAVRKIYMPVANLSLGIATRANQASAQLAQRVTSIGKKAKAGTARGVKAQPKRARRTPRKAA